jgi:hypothetical protein
VKILRNFKFPTSPSSLLQKLCSVSQASQRNPRVDGGLDFTVLQKRFKAAANCKEIQPLLLLKGRGGESKHKIGDKTILKQKKRTNCSKEGRKEGRKKERSFLRWMHARGREMLTWA